MVRAAFQAGAPCPSTGRREGACPGWIADHFVPRCAGGADAVANLWWEEQSRSLRKDRAERLLCRRLRQIDREGLRRDTPSERRAAFVQFRSALLRMGGPEAARARGAPAPPSRATY